MLLANHGENAKLRNATKDVRCDIRAIGNVAEVLCQGFFPAVWIRKARLNDDSGHRYAYFNVSVGEPQ
jgi:hypothetical protein